ncbi:MAG: glycosyltransferase [Actinomycetia bacterium]|nr:glycosyltransferase [Actinomycetes bacterium]
MTEPSSAIPPVVAVVVACDPGPWVEEALESIAAQTYPNLETLVVDTGSEPVNDTVERLLPRAVVHRVEGLNGYGAAANTVLESVEGAGFYLFLHDDVALEPEVVSTLVEEAFRSNAALLGPKMVDWNDPRQIRSVGMAIDKTGVQAPYADTGELDQEQHDRVRDVFALQSGALLVRADLFETVGGFDPEIDFLGDDVDLCWRAHVAGARVMVVPDARVRHLEALGARQPDISRRHRLLRHRVRSAFKCYGWVDLLRVLPQAFVWSVGEIVFALITGRFLQARELFGAWMWNLRRLGSYRKYRRHMRKIRRVRDSDVRRLQVGGSARFSAFVRGQIGEGSRFQDLAARGRELAGTMSEGPRRVALVVWVGLALFLLFGARHLITRDIVSFGQFLRFPSRGSLLHTFGSGWSDAELGSSGFLPAGVGLLGLGSSVLLGATDLLRKLLIVGLIPIGWVGSWRLAGPLGSRRGRLVSAVTYAAIPLAFDGIAAGRWDVLLLYAGMPFIVSRLARLIGASPYGPHGAGPGPGVVVRSVAHQVVSLALLLAVIAAFEPFVIVMTPVLAAVLVVTSILTGSLLRPLRAVVLSCLASGLALVLHAPWISRWVTDPAALWDVVVGTHHGGPTELVDIVRFSVGRWSTSMVTFGLLIVAALSLVMGRDWRATWAPRAWSIALASFLATWVATNEPVSLPALPDAHLLLMPAGVGVAWAAGITFAAFEFDVPRFGIVARRLTIGIGGLGLIVGSLSALAASAGGLYGAPTADLSGALRLIQAEPADGAFRVMWIGDPILLPSPGREIDDTLAVTASNNGMPDIRSTWSSPDNGATEFMVDAWRAALGGETARLGRLLAPMGVRYVVVPQSMAPTFAEGEVFPADPELLRTLSAQLDFDRVASDLSVVVYENEAWRPVRAVTVSDNPVLDASSATDLAATQPGEWFPALVNKESAVDYLGEVSNGTIVVGTGDIDSWVFEVDDRVVEHDLAFGWAGSYDVAASPGANLFHVARPGHGWLLLAQWVAWLIVGRIALAERRGRHEDEVL